MKKAGIFVKAVILGFIFLICILLGIFIARSFFTPPSQASSNFDGNSLQLGSMTEDEAVAQFNEQFIAALLLKIGAGRLHSPPFPFDGDKPKIQFFIEQEVYSAVVMNGQISVSRTNIDNPDVILRTNKREAVRMLADLSYASTSFSNGQSSIQKVAGDALLFSKGYVDLYESLTGKKPY